jgi:hypothetical protein
MPHSSEADDENVAADPFHPPGLPGGGPPDDDDPDEGRPRKTRRRRRRNPAEGDQGADVVVILSTTLFVSKIFHVYVYIGF